MSSICLSEAELTTFAQGKMERETARAARDHVDACVPCGSRLLAMGNGKEAGPDAGNPASLPLSETKPEPAVQANAPVATSPGTGGSPLAPAARPFDDSLPDETEGDDAWENLPAALLPGAVLAETYHVGRRIGVGGMGQVYEATHARLAGRYAVKVLHPRYATDRKALTRFRREAMIASGLRHPNIVQIIDFQTTAEGTPFLVMEYLDGQDLAKALTAGALHLERTVHIIDQVAAALTAVHRHGIVHRDLKPQNIFLIEGDYPDREMVKVVDFGISKIRAATSGLTLEQLLVGTPEYMAPEQAIGDVDHIAPATDQFALSAIAYEMLTGHPAFVANTLAVAVFQIVNKEPRPLRELAPELPVAVENVVRRGLSKKASDRFSSIGAFAEALRAAAAGATTSLGESGDGVEDHPRASGLSRSLLMGAAAGATILVGILALSGLRPRSVRGPASQEASLRSPGTSVPAPVATERHATQGNPIAAPAMNPPSPPEQVPARREHAGDTSGGPPVTPSTSTIGDSQPQTGHEQKPPQVTRLHARRPVSLPRSTGAPAATGHAPPAVPSDTLLGAPVPAAPAQGTLIEKLD